MFRCLKEINHCLLCVSRVCVGGQVRPNTESACIYSYETYCYHTILKTLHTLVKTSHTHYMKTSRDLGWKGRKNYWQETEVGVFTALNNGSFFIQNKFSSLQEALLKRRCFFIIYLSQQSRQSDSRSAAAPNADKTDGHVASFVPSWQRYRVSVPAAPAARRRCAPRYQDRPCFDSWTSSFTPNKKVHLGIYVFIYFCVHISITSIDYLVLQMRVQLGVRIYYISSNYEAKNVW